ncbi:hypothetical protein EON65_25325 [archaeon]|nr:MAG: hypothetical protein EON65_25325 [archaeon]
MKLWWLSVLLGATSLAAEISSAAVMYLLPNFYLAITDDNQTEFWRLVCIALVMITLVSILYSIKTYLSGICQVNWRVSLIKYMHSNIRSVYDKLASSTDQRVTQDVDSFCEQLADLLEKLIVSPVMLVFYSVYLAVTFGVLAVLACLVYFAIGSVLSNLFSNAIMSLVYRQSHYEGEFRLHHSHYMLHQSVIRLLFGGSSEVSEMNLIFSSLMENKLSLIKSILNLNLVTNWFAHAGGIVSYIIIGCAIFYTYPSDSSQRIVLLARGSFACMNLIYVCTSILSAANVYITVKGLYKRVQEVCDSSVYHLILYEESTRAPCGTMCGFCTKSKQSHMQGSQCCPKVMGYDVLSDDDGSSKSVKFLEEGLLMSPVISTTTIATGIKPTCLNAMSSSSVPSSNDVMLKIMHLNLSTQHIRTDQCAPPHTSAYRLLIRDLSIDVTSSMRLLITGKSGVGKSSLVQYIAQCVSEKDSESSYSVRDVQVLCDICCIMYCPQTPYHQLQVSFLVVAYLYVDY